MISLKFPLRENRMEEIVSFMNALWHSDEETVFLRLSHTGQNVRICGRSDQKLPIDFSKTNKELIGQYLSIFNFCSAHEFEISAYLDGSVFVLTLSNNNKEEQIRSLYELN